MKNSFIVPHRLQNTIKNNSRKCVKAKFFEFPEYRRLKKPRKNNCKTPTPVTSRRYRNPEKPVDRTYGKITHSAKLSSIVPFPKTQPTFHLFAKAAFARQRQYNSYSRACAAVIGKPARFLSRQSGTRYTANLPLAASMSRPRLLCECGEHFAIKHFSYTDAGEGE